ncbi:MAG: S8 family serine peptidase [Planctomycetota bacterium]|jgi:hypothetical protein
MPRDRVFEEGTIAQARQAGLAAGVFYTASAGNRGNEHHQNNFNGTTANVVIGPNTYSRPHDFGGNDFQLQATALTGSGFTFYLQWAEQFGLSGIDLDLFILDNAGNVLASSTDTQNGNDDPIEVASTTLAAGTTFQVLIDFVGAGNTTVFFDLRAFSTQTWEYLIRAGSINGASRQAEVYAAGAVRPSAPATVETFSSRGPIMRFFPTQVTRMKPDGIGLNRVSITGVGNFGIGTCPAVLPGDCLFSGTSASTPHVAGLAALLREIDPTQTPTEVTDTLNMTAVDIDAPGPDNNAGFGRLDVLAAVDSIEPLYEVDIKPGSCPNPLNRNSNGVLPVALVGTGQVCDVLDVELSTVVLSRADGVGTPVAPNEGPPGPHTVVSDVGTPFEGEACDCHELEGDGIQDLNMKFRTPEIVNDLQLNGLPNGSVIELVVTGSLLDGTPFTAMDCIRLVPPSHVTLRSNIAGIPLLVTPADDDLNAGGVTPLDLTYPQSTVVTITAPLVPDGHPNLILASWWIDGVEHFGLGTNVQVLFDEDYELVMPVYRPPCPWDINRDGVVNVLDLIDLLPCLGQPAVPPCDTGQDINGDGLVNALELVELLLAFGTTCP